jgi:acyl dehydratase
VRMASEMLNKWTEKIPVTYCQRDMALYSLGIGSQDLRYIYEKDKNFDMFPTFPFVLAFKGDSQEVVGFPSPAMIKTNVTPPLKGIKAGLDGQRYLEILKPMPTKQGLHTFYYRTRLTSLKVNPKGVVMEQEALVEDEAGEAYVRMISSAFLVGAKAEASMGESKAIQVKIPDREPDAIQEHTTSVNQAMIYRLSGDYNPLHIDPRMSKMMGFKEPILHGLCTLGHAARAALTHFCDNDAQRFKALQVRFAKPVLPGQTLVTSMWKEGDRVLLQTAVKETGKVVLNNAFVEIKPLPAKL